MAAACLAGTGACSVTHHAAAAPPAPAPSTSIATSVAGTAYTEAQVLGWITPTVDNGVSFVVTLPPGASAAQLFRASQSLSVACGVARHELAETTWTGPAAGDTSALSGTLGQVVTLVATHPGLGFAQMLDVDVQRVSEGLKRLTADVNG